MAQKYNNENLVLYLLTTGGWEGGVSSSAISFNLLASNIRIFHSGEVLEKFLTEFQFQHNEPK